MLEKFVELKILKASDYSDNYLSWMNDKDVVKYSENRFKSFSKKGQINYINSFIDNKKNFLYGIFFKKKHIGNIVLGPIKNKTSEITYMIGDKNYWGMGIGSFVIHLIINKAKHEHKLSKLSAGCASKNFASARILLKNNFKLDKIVKNHFSFDSEKMDLNLYCLDID